MKIRKQIPNSFHLEVSNRDALFHYTKRSTAIDQILASDTYRLSSLTETNDPYEYNDRHFKAGKDGHKEGTTSNQALIILRNLLKENIFLCQVVLILLIMTS